MSEQLSVSQKTLKNRRKRKERKMKKLLQKNSNLSLSQKLKNYNDQTEMEENIFAHYGDKSRSGSQVSVFPMTTDSSLHVSDSHASHNSVSKESFSQNVYSRLKEKKQQRIFKQKILSKWEHNVIQRQRQNLPVFSVKEELLNVFATENVIVLKGETACGKTTQIPQFILEGGFVQDKAIAVTQPRRVAAITIAERVAKEVGTTLGRKVGYCVRFDDMTSEETRIKYVTDGMLLRESISDPLLSSYSWVILDEAHERTIHTDVLFGIVKAAQRVRAKERLSPLKIIIMSATIDEEKIMKYFNNAPIYTLPCREYSIAIYNSQHEVEDYMASALSTVFHIHQNNNEGHILVFLTGEEEIESMVEQTRKVASELPDAEMKLFPCSLYAALPSHVQCAVLKPSPEGIRKVIYSTNIAETSLTIPGIKYVVDTGVVKSKTFNSTCGLDLLKVQKISKAQAEQRTGRAGRECEGYCYRLYTKEHYETLADFPIPEIQRCSLSSVILQIIAMGISNIRDFDFLDRPSDENINAAIEQLVNLGAIEEDGTDFYLTECGKQMVSFPLDPRFSKIIIASKEYKCTDEVLTIISLLSVETIFIAPVNEREIALKLRERFSNGEGDHMMLLNLYKEFRSAKSHNGWCISHHVNYKSMLNAVAIRKQLSEICQKAGIVPCSCGPDTSAIRKCLVTGLFMNSAHLYKNRIYRTIGSNQKVFIHPSSCLFKKKLPCCIYTDLVETSRCYMRNISIVDEDWLLDVAPEYFKSHGFHRFQLMSV